MFPRRLDQLASARLLSELVTGAARRAGAHHRSAPLRPRHFAFALLVCGGVVLATQAAPVGAQGFALGVRVDFPTGVNPRSAVIGDVNGDGKPDLVVANQISNTVSVLLGNGIGGFGPKTDFATGVGTHAVVMGDPTWRW